MDLYLRYDKINPVRRGGTGGLPTSGPALVDELCRAGRIAACTSLVWVACFF